MCKESFNSWKLSIVPNERIPLVIELCATTRIGFFGKKYYYAPFDIMHYLSSDVGFINIVV